MSATYQVSHATRYRYNGSVSMCQNQLRLTPRVGIDQLLTKHRIEVLPKPTKIYDSFDFFGNQVHYFEIQQPHTELVITMQGTVEVTRPKRIPCPSPPWEFIAAEIGSDTSLAGIERYQFAFPSSLVPRCAQAQQLAQTIFRPSRPILEAVIELNSRIYHEFKYDPNATTIQTPLGDVFDMKRGVCQDFAHVALACLRAVGLAGKYVSGYLRTYAPQDPSALVGADASHAWISVYLGPLGWVDFDPTNNLIVEEQHIVLAWGRDFRDVTPINGLYVGADQQSLDVVVQVRPMGKTT